MANLSNINGKFVVDTAGNIGVGTLIPRSDANTTNISIQSSGTARLFVNNTGASGKEYAIYSSANGDFGIFDYGAVSARLVINSAGNATFAGTVETTTLRTDVINNKANSANIIYRSGTQTIIGGGSSTQKLKIEDGGDATFAGNVKTGGNLSNAAGLSLDGSNNNFRLLYNNTASYRGNHGWRDLQFGNNGSNDIIAGNTGAGGYLRFFVNNTNDCEAISTPNGTLAMNILANGNVGIGTTTPSYPLEVAGVEVSAKFIGDQAGHVQGSILLSSNTTDTPEARGQGVYRFNEGNDDTWYTGTAYANTNKYIWARKANTTSFDSGTAQLTYAMMTLTNGGNVGIGTTSPSSKFQVEGAPANGVYLSYLYNSATHNSANGLNVQTSSNNILTYGLRVNTAGDSNALAVMGNGSVGIGTGSPRATLEVDGELIVKDIKHSNFAVGSLNTTGYTIATVTGSGNGASAVVEFTGIGGTNGVVDVVYSCTNQGGSWYAAARPRQTAVKVDVVVTGNGTTTLSFVFKSLSGTQGYTPRLMMKGTPPVLVTF